MKVLERGQAPQKQLRLHPSAGSVQRLSVVSESSTTLRDAGSRKPMPPSPGLRMVLSAEVLRVSPDGDVDYRFVLEGMDLLVADGTPAAPVEALRKELEPLPGLTGEGRVSATGRSNAFTLKLPPGLSAPLRAQTQQMQSMLSGMGTFLPSEPVGLGASWEQGGLGDGPLSGTCTTLTLKSLDAEGVGLRIALSEPPRPQPVPSALRAQGGDTPTLHTQVKGKGGCLLSLDRLWPTRFELEVDSHAALRAGSTESPRRLDGFTNTRLRMKELSFTRPVVRGISLARNF